MQVDPPDAGPHSTASPPLSPFRPQRTLARDDVQLRRTAAAPTPTAMAGTAPTPHFSNPATMLKMHLWMPYADLAAGPAARNGWSVAASTTVREAKVAIASGSAGYGQWDPQGLRLIWRGRLLLDEEVLESVFVGVEEPTVHVVARPLADAPAPRTRPSQSGNPDRTPAPAAVPSHLTAPPSPDNIALADTIHYLIFVCREHMCAIIGRRPLAWQDTYPAPTVIRAEAYEAILTVVRAYAGDEWTAALQGDGDHKALEGAWAVLGTESMAAEVCTLWRDLLGREYGLNGDVAQIELDLKTFTLHLPALKDMVPAQLTHLLFYLRTASLVRFLSSCLAEREVSARVAAQDPTPTPTIPTETDQAHPPRIMYQNSIRIRVPRMRISFALVQHLFWSALRILTMLWMLTRGMAWQDMRFWLLVGAAGGWWAIDGFNHWMAEDRTRRVARLRRAMQAEAVNRDAAPVEGADEGVPPMDAAGQAAVDAPLHAAAAARAGAAGIRGRQPAGARRHRGTELLMYGPYVHLDVDAQQLRIRSLRFHGPGLNATATRIHTLPNEQPAPPELLPEPRRTPHWLQTRVLLPIGLWFLTLIPAFEAQRAREIRQRERNMRAVIAALNPAAATDPANDDPDTPAINDNDTASTGENSEPLLELPIPAPELLLPEGLSEQTRKYYLRVAATTEAIDWEEERAAQRAMGIPDEDEGVAAGAGFMAALL